MNPSSNFLNRLSAVMMAKGYKIFNDPRGHDLNIVGIRTDDNHANSFNDWLVVFYKFGSTWNKFPFPCTTDPGVYYRENPANVRGTAIIKPGQYRGAYKIGKHRGYTALQQKGPITVYRDADQNDTLDINGEEDHGIHAVNIHRASKNHASTQVDKWSAGCQVLQDPEHFNFLMAMCRKAAVKYGNSFTYTLLEESDFNGG